MAKKKQLKSDINGKIFKVIYNMYYDTKSCISLNGDVSAFFERSCGTRF